MSAFGKSQAAGRVEDARFLTGQGRYVEDTVPGGALHALFLRSSVAHGEITALDVEDARAMPGVHLVMTAADLRAAGVSLAMPAGVVENRDGTKGANPIRPLLAEGRVRFVGEAVAMVVADTPDAARDAIEAIAFDTEDLEPSLEVAIGAGPQIHPEAPENLAYDWAIGDAVATEAAIAEAAHVVRLRIEDNRIIPNSMEPRGCWAEFADGRLHLSVNGQGVWGQRDELADLLGMEKGDVRVTNPDVGGGFGTKAFSYPEYFAVAQAARQLGQPVRWMSERIEAMLSDNAGRDLISDAVLAFDADFKITGYKVDLLSNLGAYNSANGQAIQSVLFSKVLTGVYDIGAACLNARGVYTNTTQVDAYRGAGRPEAIYTLERIMDRAARALKIDPWELRRRNFIAADAFPYRTVVGETYDVGDFKRVLDRAALECDLAGFADRCAASEADGKLRGLGVCFYVEAILGAPREVATITFDADGGVSLFVGTQSNGQGHETVFTQVLSDQTGVPVDKIRMVQGDSDQIEWGGGTGGSRSGTMQAHATRHTGAHMIAAFTPFIAEHLGVEEAAVRFEDGTFRAEASNLRPTVLEVADLARAAGRHDLLRHSETYKLPARSYPNGAHICEVEVDPDTGAVDVLAYTITDDFGTLLNAQIVEGQVQGGVVQGIGQALNEHVVFDDSGQPLTASFMDYALPRAKNLPMFKFTTEPTRSTANPLGMKGCGEAGTVGALAAVANAVQDAVASAGVGHVDMPFTPMRVWSWLNEEQSDIS